MYCFNGVPINPSIWEWIPDWYWGGYDDEWTYSFEEDAFTMAPENYYGNLGAVMDMYVDQSECTIRPSTITVQFKASVAPGYTPEFRFYANGGTQVPSTPDAQTQSLFNNWGNQNFTLNVWHTLTFNLDWDGAPGHANYLKQWFVDPGMWYPDPEDYWFRPHAGPPQEPEIPACFYHHYAAAYETDCVSPEPTEYFAELRVFKYWALRDPNDPTSPLVLDLFNPAVSSISPEEPLNLNTFAIIDPGTFEIPATTTIPLPNFDSDGFPVSWDVDTPGDTNFPIMVLWNVQAGRAMTRADVAAHAITHPEWLDEVPIGGFWVEGEFGEPGDEWWSGTWLNPVTMTGPGASHFLARWDGEELGQGPEYVMFLIPDGAQDYVNDPYPRRVYYKMGPSVFTMTYSGHPSDLIAWSQIILSVGAG
jgi:hypothetical protein